MIKPCSVNDLVFLSTPSARRATVYTLNGATKNTDFYPRPLRGGRQVSKNLTAEVYTFLSTPSARRATKKHGNKRRDIQYFYPRPLRGGRLFC